MYTQVWSFLSDCVCSGVCVCVCVCVYVRACVHMLFDAFGLKYELGLEYALVEKVQQDMCEYCSIDCWSRSAVWR